MMRVIIAGSRDILNPETFTKAMNQALNDTGWEITTVLSGNAKGIDRYGEWWAAQRNIPIEKYPADWNKHGKAAGPIRNEEMAKKADALIAIWDGESRGTLSMMELAVKYKLKHVCINVKEN